MMKIEKPNDDMIKNINETETLFPVKKCGEEFE